LNCENRAAKAASNDGYVDASAFTFVIGSFHLGISWVLHLGLARIESNSIDLVSLSS